MFNRFAVLIVVGLLTRTALAADDRIIADFEGADYADWTTTGTAFGTGPAQGTLPNQQAVTGYKGKGLVDSYVGGDHAQGTLTSPEFVVERPYISFLIGGGCHPGRTCINLLVDKKVVATATGLDEERLRWFTWDVKAFQGKHAEIQIVDRESGGWGHINVDQVMQTDNPPVPPETPQILYGETYRPQFHFSSATNWINDPNGLVYFDGEYHLFFQHNPSGINWGNMTWGHAVSPDLVHWTQLADALSPDDLGTMYSGSAVVDWKNTTGFATGKGPALIAMYTAAGGENARSKGKGYSQCIAYSNDRGRTWTKYDKNPVIAHIAGGNRDPKMVWYEPSRRWIVAIYLDGDEYALFSSPDLKQWTQLQKITFPGNSECPDFFPITLDGDPGKTKWVFTSAAGNYLVGSFDGKQFVAEQTARKVDFGSNCYAVQTYSDIPATDGRRIQIGWMRDGKYPRMPFNGQMSFPTQLTLHSTAAGFRLFKYPVKEIEKLRGPAVEFSHLDVSGDSNALAAVKGDLFDIEAEIDPGTSARVGLNIRGATVAYSTAKQTLDALGTAPLQIKDGRLTLRILVDRASIETFVDGGRVALSSCFLPDPDAAPLALFSEGGQAKFVKLTIYPLRSAWPGN